MWVFLWFLKSLVLNELSNAPSNCRYKHMQSCIGYIYPIFPQCDFPEWIFKCAFKGKVTLVACVRLFSGASFLVSQCKVTLVAFVGFFTNMRFKMCFQITCPNWCKVTLVAIFSRVDFQMCPQIACLNRGKFILFAFMRSVFKCLHEQMQSFIGCIVRFLSSVGFLIISQDPWSYRCKIT